MEQQNTVMKAFWKVELSLKIYGLVKKCSKIKVICSTFDKDMVKNSCCRQSYIKFLQQMKGL